MCKYLNQLKGCNKLLFYYNTLALLLLKLQQHFLHTTPSQTFTQALLERVFCNLQPASSHWGNSCSPAKAKTVTCEKFELSCPTFSCHSE